MIETYSFGSMTIAGKAYHDDLMIIRSEVRPHWRRNRGHSVDTSDLREILDAGPDIVVIGTGASDRVQIDPDLSGSLKGRGIRLLAQPTKEAAETFNRLVSQGENVAAGFHLTC